MADQSFQQEFLQTHNSFRSQHGAQLMRLSDELSAAAQKWADHLLEQNLVQHSDTQDGENIYNELSSEPLTLTGKEAVEKWYGEIQDYSWSSPGHSLKTGHFTQVVWNDSTELGVGLATDGHKVFVVGQYRPAGNVESQDQFEKNVFKAADGGSKPEVASNPKKTCTLL